ncbi:piggyBac transposable element-derived protein 4-like [Harmonia axyridis]|uniref:piggyBac transposable element-derived protein 4-like n=1 Tax=Harmonia axyridis TaxID=115357 RepID=UPI001E27613F|nr:piggyBac transposable element-derived protein 4-like [Harmonia axyridis]
MARRKREENVCYGEVTNRNREETIISVAEINNNDVPEIAVSIEGNNLHSGNDIQAGISCENELQTKGNTYQNEEEGQHEMEGEELDFSDIDSANEPFGSDDSVVDKDYSPDSSTDSDIRENDARDSETPLSSDDAVPSTNDVETTQSDSGEWNRIGGGEENSEFRVEKCTLANIDASEIRNPIDIFNLFITDDILDIIVTETNNYAAQQLLNTNHSRKSRLNAWTKTNWGEIRAFLGVTLAMGLTEVPHINLYWSKDDIFYNKFISNTFRRDRYLLLLKLLHFENNETCDISNRLYKIEKVVSKLLQNFQTILQPGNILVIDESMVPFRGRLKFRQYIPNKTHRYGIKLYKLCSPEGFNTIIYTGKGETNPDLGHSQSIVIKLLQCVENKSGKLLFADNFYSGISLVKNLMQNENMMYCGTLRANRRDIPKVFKLKKKMKSGEIFGEEKDGVKIIKWMDKRPVLMISSVSDHNTKVFPVGKKNRKGEDVLKPKCITDYNAAKKGVDYSDQMSSYHSVLRKSMKWYRKVMLELILGTAVVNSLIIYNMCARTKLSVTEFRRQLAYSLIQPPEKPKTPRRRTHNFCKPEGPGRERRKLCKGCRQILKSSCLDIEK